MSERRTLTMLHAVAVDAVPPPWARLVTAARVHGGEDVRIDGAALQAAFGSSLDAFSCAVAIQRAVTRWRPPVALGLGISAGDVVRGDSGWRGRAEVRAVELAQAAGPGVVLVDDVVRRLVIACRPLLGAGLQPAKGVDALAWRLPWRTEPLAQPLPSELALARHPAFVGRESERARLLDAWQRASGGERLVVLVSGEPGIGKTRLVAELAAEVHRAGATVLYGRCDEEATASYQPFAEAIGAYVATRSPSRLWLDIGPPLAELMRLVPALRGTVPATEPPGAAANRLTGTAEGDARYLLFAAVDALLNAAADAGPVLLVLDDLHWADGSTLLLLRHLVEATDRIPLLVLGTYRDTDLDRRHPLASVLTDLRRRALLDRVTLRGLATGEIAQIVGRFTGEATADEQHRLAETLRSETDGNPLFISEVLRHLADVDALPDGGGGSVTALDVGLPEGLRDVISRRLSRLSTAANRALRAGAVVGREFDVTLIAKLPDTGAEGDELLAVLDEAARARLLSEVPSLTGRRYAFVHALVRQTLYEELSEARRARLHRHVAQALEPLLDSRPELLPAVAHHFRCAAAGGFGLPAAMYSLRAAEAALDRAAFEEAVDHLMGGLEALELDVDDQTLRCDLLLALATARRLVLDVDGGRAAAIEAAELARQIGSPDRLARALVRYGVDETKLGRLDQAVVHLAAEASAALGERDLALRAQVLAAEALARAYGGDADRARELSEQALDLAERSGSIDALTDAVMARYASLAGAADGAAKQLELVNRFPELAAPAASARPRTSSELTGWPNLQLGDRAAFDRAVDELERFAAGNPTPVLGSLVAVRRGAQALLDGRFDDVEPHATRAVQLSSGMAFTAHTFRAQLAWRAMERGEEDTVLEMMAESAAANPGLPAYRAGVAFALASSGRLDEAEREIALVPVDRLVRDWTYTAQLTLLMEAAALLGDVDRATALEALARPYQGQLALIGEAVVIGTVDRALGVVASLLGRHDEAEEWFEAALALEHRVQAPPMTARTACWYARMLAHRDGPGDGERAVRLALHAARTATRLGMAGVARDATALAAATGARP